MPEREKELQVSRVIHDAFLHPRPSHVQALCLCDRLPGSRGRFPRLSGLEGGCNRHRKQNWSWHQAAWCYSPLHSYWSEGLVCILGLSASGITTAISPLSSSYPGKHFWGCWETVIKDPLPKKRTTCLRRNSCLAPLKKVFWHFFYLIKKKKKKPTSIYTWCFTLQIISELLLTVVDYNEPLIKTLPAWDRQCVYVYSQIPVLLTSESERDGVREDLLQGIIHIHKTKQNNPASFAQSIFAPNRLVNWERWPRE